MGPGSISGLWTTTQIKSWCSASKMSGLHTPSQVVLQDFTLHTQSQPRTTQSFPEQNSPVQRYSHLAKLPNKIYLEFQITLTGRHLKYLFSLPNGAKRDFVIWIKGTRMFGQPTHKASLTLHLSYEVNQTQSGQPFLPTRNLSNTKGNSHCSAPWVGFRFSPLGPLGKESCWHMHH